MCQDVANRVQALAADPFFQLRHVNAFPLLLASVAFAALNERFKKRYLFGQFIQQYYSQQLNYKNTSVPIV